jgi:hypothetical protein
LAIAVDEKASNRSGLRYYQKCIYGLEMRNVERR